MICHQIEALKEAGCDEVVLAINYRPQVMMDFLKEWEVKLGIKITCSQEPEPMGTAGPLALARAILDDGSGTPFFVLNSDVICEYPLRELLAFHEARGAEAGRHEREHEAEHVLDDLVLGLLLRRAQRVDLAVEPVILVWAVVGDS